MSVWHGSVPHTHSKIKKQELSIPINMRLWIKLFCILTFLAIVCSCSKDSSYNVSEEVDIVLSASFLDSCTVRSGNNSAEGGVANADWTKYDLRYIIEIYDAD